MHSMWMTPSWILEIRTKCGCCEICKRSAASFIASDEARCLGDRTATPSASTSTTASLPWKRALTWLVCMPAPDSEVILCLPKIQKTRAFEF